MFLIHALLGSKILQEHNLRLMMKLYAMLVMMQSQIWSDLIFLKPDFLTANSYKYLLYLGIRSCLIYSEKV